MTPLDSINAKIVWAKHHFEALQMEYEGYFQTNPIKIVRQAEGDPNQYVGKAVVNEPLPLRFPLLIGDIIQNMRSSLDYLVRELVLAAKNEPSDHEMFPICPTPKAFKDTVRGGRLDGIPEDAVAVIAALQPYNLGQDWKKATLWAINELSNINKHRRLLITKVEGGSGIPMDLRIVEGQIFAQADLARMKQNTKIGPFDIVASGQVKVDSQIIVYIAFDEGPVEGMEVGACIAPR